MRRILKNDEGFTLIEMSLVLFIISALLLLFIPNISGNKDSATKTGSEAFQTVLQSQVEMYVMDKGTSVESFDVMSGAGYLTASQLKDAEKDFTINNGIVERKVKE